MTKEKKKIVIISSAIAAVIAVGVFLILLFTVILPNNNENGDKLFEITSVQIIVSSDAENNAKFRIEDDGSITTLIGKNPLKLEVVVNNDEVNFDEFTKPQAQWSIAGDNFGASINNSGELTFGEIIGDITVRATVSSQNEMTAEIAIAIRSPLVSIEVTNPPNKLLYIEGEEFNRDGLEVTAHFEHFSAVIIDYTISPKILTPEIEYITISYSFFGVTRTANIEITVSGRTLQSVEVFAPPNNVSFIEGQTFDPTGLVLTAIFEHVSIKVTDFVVDVNTPLTPDISEIEVFYTEGGTTKSTVIPIFVARRTLQSLEIISQPTTTDYVEGQVFDASGLRLRAIFEYVQIDEIDFEFDEAKQLFLTDTYILVYFTENNVTREIQVPISVIAGTLQFISVDTTLVNLSYIEGQVFNPTGLVVTAHFEYFERAATNFMVDTETILLPSVKAWQVSYAVGLITQTEEITISVANKTLQRIEIYAPPTRTSYIEGETFDASGLRLTAIFEYLSYETTDFVVDEIAILSPSKTSVIASYTYRGMTREVEVSITVARKTLQSISLDHSSVQTSFIEGQRFNSTGLIVTAHFEFISETVTDFTVDTVSLLLPTHTHWQVSFTYNNVTRYSNIPVTVATRILQSIEVTTLPNTTNYIEGQIFSSSGIVVTAHFEYRSIVVTDFSVDLEGQILAYNDTTVTVSFTENSVTRTTTFALNITDNLLESIEIVSKPTRLSYTVGDSLSLLGLVLRGHYTNGDTRLLFGATSNRNNPLALGDEEVILSYTEFVRQFTTTRSVGFNITIIERYLTQLNVVTNPTRTNFIEGEFLSLLGLELEAVFSDGSREVITNFVSTLTNRALKICDTSITISFTSGNITLQTEINITVSPRVLTDLKINYTNVLREYKTNDRLNLSGLVVTAVFNDGAIEENITSFTVDLSGQALSVTDTEFVVSFAFNGVTLTSSVSIVVTPRTLTGISITQNPIRITFNEGEFFDPLGLVVTASFSNAPDAIVRILSFSIMRALVLGDEEIIIYYTENGITMTAALVITVLDRIPVSVRNLINLIDEMLHPENLLLEQIDAVFRLQSLYENMSQAYRNQVTNAQKLRDLILAANEILDNLPPEPEPEFVIAYRIYGELSFVDIDFGANVTLFKNSDGEFALIAPTSAIAKFMGFEFIRFIRGDTLLEITHISDLNANLVIYAVFGLTQTVVIEFYDFSDRETSLHASITAARINAAGSYSFTLDTEAITSAIQAILNRVSFAFYYTLFGEAIRIFSVGGMVNTSLGAIVRVYIVTAELRMINLENELDASLSWVFSYIDDYSEENFIYASFPPGASFNVPVGAIVTLTAINPALLDFSLDGEKQNMTHPQRAVVFELLEGSAPLEITFEMALGDRITITFTGVNSIAFIHNLGWDGILSNENLSQLAFIFDVENDTFISVFIIENSELLFEDLATFVFGGNTHVLVVRQLRIIPDTITLTLYLYNDTYIITPFILDGTNYFDRLPSDWDRDSYEFLGWSQESGGEPLTSITFNAFIVSLGDSVTIFALWRELPREIIDYSDKSFVGTWSSSSLNADLSNLNNELGIIEIAIVLNCNGTFTYQVRVNGHLVTDLFGEYRYIDGKLYITLLRTTAQSLLFDLDDIVLDIRFTCDNILIANALITQGMITQSINMSLTNGEVRPVITGLEELAGDYEYVQTTIVQGATTHESFQITILENGTAIITMTTTINDVIVFNAVSQGLMRIYGDEILFISNSSLGIFDITQILSVSIKDSNMANPQAGTWIAADEHTHEFWSSMIISSDGLVTFSALGVNISAYLIATHQDNFVTMITINDTTFAISLTFLPSGALRVIMTNVQTGEQNILNFALI